MFKGHTVNTALELLNSNEDLNVIIAEFIDDWSDSELRKCLIFIIGRTLNILNFPYSNITNI